MLTINYRETIVIELYKNTYNANIVVRNHYQ